MSINEQLNGLDGLLHTHEKRGYILLDSTFPATSRRKYELLFLKLEYQRCDEWPHSLP